MQVGIIHATTDLLQLAKLRLAQEITRLGIPGARGREVEDAAPHYHDLSSADNAEQRLATESTPALAPNSKEVLDAASPDLHSLGKLFLDSDGARIVFDIAVFFHFIFILISYTLAGSQSVASLLGLNVKLSITVYSLLLTAIVVTFSRVLQPVIAACTVIKATIFLVIITVMCAVFVSVCACTSMCVCSPIACICVCV